jgi:hypothetical protein
MVQGGGRSTGGRQVGVDGAGGQLEEVDIGEVIMAEGATDAGFGSSMTSHIGGSWVLVLIDNGGMVLTGGPLWLGPSLLLGWSGGRARRKNWALLR